jgi:hypothetical protein
MANSGSSMVFKAGKILGLDKASTRIFSDMPPYPHVALSGHHDNGIDYNSLKA